MIELERTFLVKTIPEGLVNSPKKEMLDIYLPQNSPHPTLRIRKQGDKVEITKKEPVNEGDSSRMMEQTIPLRIEEFNELEKNVTGKRVHKMRYYYNYNGRTVEFDVFLDELSGLILADVEFELENEKDNYQLPEFALKDVTQESFVAGGMLCGKKYQDIERELKRFNYQKLELE